MGEKGKHLLLPPCDASCRLKCSLRYSPEIRQAVLTRFWGGNFEAQRLFLLRHIQIHQITAKHQSNRARQDVRQRRFSQQYMLEDDDNTALQVCKTMFLHTLGLRTDGKLTRFRRSLTSNQGILRDKRGGDHLTDPDCTRAIIEDINSYHPQVSHYAREHAPLRIYLPATLSVKTLHQAYQQAHLGNPVCYTKYRRVFTHQRITFGNPKPDLCDLCHAAKIHLKNPHKPGEPACLQCGQYVLHQKQFTICRQFYQQDTHNEAIADGHTAIFAMDMQKILLLPMMTTKNHFFVSRLV